MAFLFVNHLLYMKRGYIDGGGGIDSFQNFCNQFVFHGNNNRDDVAVSKIAKTDEINKVQEEEEAGNSSGLDPFVAPYPNRYRDKFSSPCNICFNQW